MKLDKSMVIAALVCVNLLLATTLALGSYSLPAAHAQGAGLSGNYMVVAGEVQDGYDAIYLIDLQTRMLHVLYHDRGARQLEYGGNRNLEVDFRNKEKG